MVEHATWRSLRDLMIATTSCKRTPGSIAISCLVHSASFYCCAPSELHPTSQAYYQRSAGVECHLHYIAYQDDAARAPCCTVCMLSGSHTSSPRRKYAIISYPGASNPFPHSLVNFHAIMRCRSVTVGNATFLEWTGQLHPAQLNTFFVSELLSIVCMGAAHC